MRIFISYVSEDRDTAEEVHMALLGAGHQTFFDKAKLPPGQDYHSRIQAAVNQCDAFVFLIIPHSRFTASRVGPVRPVRGKTGHGMIRYYVA
jgi:hypothetical protein